MARLYVEWLDNLPIDGEEVYVNGHKVGVYRSRPDDPWGFSVDTGTKVVGGQEFAELVFDVSFDTWT